MEKNVFRANSIKSICTFFTLLFHISFINDLIFSLNIYLQTITTLTHSAQLPPVKRKYLNSLFDFYFPLTSSIIATIDNQPLIRLLFFVCAKKREIFSLLVPVHVDRVIDICTVPYSININRELITSSTTKCMTAHGSKKYICPFMYMYRDINM